MMKTYRMILGLVMILSMLAACSSSDNQDLIVVGDTVAFERIGIEETDISIDEARQEQGCETQGRYLIVYGGEKPTAGYSIEVTEIIYDEGTATVTVVETSPPEGSMAADVLTYPVDVVLLPSEITGPVELVFVDTGTEEAGASPSDGTSYAEGEYVGQIDSNSIEVIVDGAAAAFYLADAAKEQITLYETGDAVAFEYQLDEQGHNIIISFGEMTTVVTFEGQMDPHSIEVMTEDGAYDWFQLTGDALEQAGSLDTGDIVKIIYSVNESGQKVASQLIKIEK